MSHAFHASTALFIRVFTAVTFFVVVSTTAVSAQEQRANRPASQRAGQHGDVPADLEVLKNIVYKEIDGKKLDLWLFPTAKKLEGHSPVVLMIHGGGWGKGDKTAFLRGVFLDVLKELTKEGVTCAAIEYRLARTGGPNAMEAVADCLDAAAYLVKHAEKYRLDPQRIAIFGGSAGGHLSMTTVLADPKNYPCDPELNPFRPKLKCCVAYYGASSMMHEELFVGSNFERPQRLIPILGGTLEQKPEIARLLSPVELIHEKMPPLLLIHGEEDHVLSVRHSTYLFEQSSKRGLPVELITVKNADHGFRGERIMPSLVDIEESTVEFLIKHLHNKN